MDEINIYNLDDVAKLRNKRKKYNFIMVPFWHRVAREVEKRKGRRNERDKIS